MKTFVLIALVACLFVSGCNHSNQKIDNSSKPIVYPLLIDINNGFDNRKELPLSEIASEIEYVKLEFTEKSAISALYNIHITDEYIFVRSYKVDYLMQFDRNGKFLRQIGTIGRGPKEYLLCMDFTVNETTRQIIIRDNWNHHLYFYDYNGVFQKKMNVSVNAYDIISLSTGEIVCSARQTWGDPISFMLLGYDNKGDTTFIKKSWFYKKYYQATAFYTNKIFSNNDSVFYNEFFGDIIYLYNSRSMVPYYILKWDKFKDPAVFNMTAYGRKEILENYAKVFQLKLFQSTPGYLYIYYKYHFNNYLGRFNKKTREIVFYEGVKELGCMKNDFDGGITVNPIFDAGNNKWVAELPADSLIRTLTPEYFAKSKAMYPEKKEELKKLVENLKENDNPVIMIITLK